MSIVNCACGEQYLFNLADFEEHCKNNERHRSYLNSIDPFEIICQCGATYNYKSQNNHFKSNYHKSWQNLSADNYYKVKYICKCGVIYVYMNKDDHLRTHPSS